jgi:hypothetical protein
VGTDIYGAVEVRNPDRDGIEEYDTLWVHGIDLYPLYAGGDYQSLGCLFGVRNWNGWDPVAAGRGLPDDVSEQVRTSYEYLARIDAAIHAATWITWPELRDLDMSVTPRARGVLDVNADGKSLHHLYRIEDTWPDEVIDRYGPPPIGATPADAGYGTWQQDTTTFVYRQVTRHDVLGPATGWEHVFAVMRALAARFGDDGVRLVVWFD